MTKTFKHKDFTWIDLENPSPSEIESIKRDFDIHPVAAGELGGPSYRSRVDVYNNFLYVILHFPTCQICFGEERASNETEEIDFIVGKDFIITVHYQKIDALYEFSKRFEADWVFGEERDQLHPVFVFYYLVRQMYQSLAAGLEYINRSLKSAEHDVFTGKEREMVERLSKINRNLIDFRWALKTHREVLGSLVVAGREFFSANFNYYFHSIEGEYAKIWNMLENNRDTFKDIQITNNSLLSIKTNDIMKTLTILAFITLPLSVFTSLFGMNTAYLPIVGRPNDFWIVVGVMVVSVAGMFIVFRHKKWL